MFDRISIQSHKGAYEVIFEGNTAEQLARDVFANAHFIIDRRVAELYADFLKLVLESSSVLLVEATEENKSLDRFPDYVEHLVSKGIRRQHHLVAIGGGIIQDITCFLAATLLRGLPWKFYPTTLLAQADSCIGSKSSINSRGVKNILGTFTPPSEVWISTNFLKTLKEEDLRSGIGEMLKVHAIDSPEAFESLAQNYDYLLSDSALLLNTIKKSLLIKKKIIELDEFDLGIRNIMNYGHSFGHAIESAVNYAIPHGIAITMGMDIANYISANLDHASNEFYEAAHPTLSKNYVGYRHVEIPMDDFFLALTKDKKNLDASSVALILPNATGQIEKKICAFDESFKKLCHQYFDNVY